MSEKSMSETDVVATLTGFLHTNGSLISAGITTRQIGPDSFPGKRWKVLFTTGNHSETDITITKETFISIPIRGRNYPEWNQKFERISAHENEVDTRQREWSTDQIFPSSYSWKLAFFFAITLRWVIKKPRMVDAWDKISAKILKDMQPGGCDWAQICTVIFLKVLHGWLLWRKESNRSQDNEG
jgi:hypothetical protein